jgi:protein pelota
VKMGAYHTLSLELQRKFTLTKENWDAIALERVDEACDSGITHFNLSACFKC